MMTIKDRPSPLQDAIIAFVHRYTRETGQAPSLRTISEACEMDGIRHARYHVQRCADRGFLERRVAQAVLVAGKSDCGRPLGSLSRQGSCPERARAIVTLLRSDRFAVDRLARLTSGEWRSGVAL
ncbi:MAG: hypothetical protein J0I12_11295 [Candidatus Eremiobacteraeota bacterium]|nr:hypothetical protein [Candidatus Eremiobacteraeota bacterium]